MIWGVIGNLLFSPQTLPPWKEGCSEQGMEPSSSFATLCHTALSIPWLLPQAQQHFEKKTNIELWSKRLYFSQPYMLSSVSVVMDVWSPSQRRWRVGTCSEVRRMTALLGCRLFVEQSRTRKCTTLCNMPSSSAMSTHRHFLCRGYKGNESFHGDRRERFTLNVHGKEGLGKMIPGNNIPASSLRLQFIIISKKL